MNRKTKAFFVIGAIIIGGAVLFHFTSTPPYRPSGVHPYLLALKPPFKSVDVSYYLDGGSIGVKVTPQSGNRTAFALPIQDAQAKEKYSQLYLGDFSHTNLTNVIVSLNKDSRNYIICFIDKHAKDGPDKRAALMYLRGHLKDYLKLFWPYSAEIQKQLNG